MLDSAEDVLQRLEQTRLRLHVLDDDTIGRVRETQALERLTQQLAARSRVLTASLACAEDLPVIPIEQGLAQDDRALALEPLRDNHKPSPAGCDTSTVTFRVPLFSPTAPPPETLG